MIYKTELRDCSISEVEYNKPDKLIFVHISQGYRTKNNEIIFGHYMNFSLEESHCKDLIKSLQLALEEYKQDEKATS